MFWKKRQKKGRGGSSYTRAGEDIFPSSVSHSRKEIAVNSNRSTRTMIGAGILAFLFLSSLIVVWTHYKRIEPGQVGILVDYGKSTSEGKPVIKNLSVGYHVQWIRQRIVQYPVAQQTLIMVYAEKEGKVVGDDSVQCQDQNGVQLEVDSATYWRVNVNEAGELFLLRPNVPLNNSGGGDIEDLVVRSDVRNAIATACGQFTYDSIFGEQRVAFQQDVATILTSLLTREHLVLDQFAVREIHLGEQQMNAINDVSVARQNVIKSSLLKQQADNEAAAAVAKAEGDKQVSIKQAEAQAESIRIIQEQLAQSPAYLAYLQVTKWDGRLPQYINGTGDSNLLLPFTP